MVGGTVMAASGTAIAYSAGKTIIAHLPGPPAHYDPDLDSRNPIEATFAFAAAGICAAYGVREVYRTLRMPKECEAPPINVSIDRDNSP